MRSNEVRICCIEEVRNVRMMEASASLEKHHVHLGIPVVAPEISVNLTGTNAVVDDEAPNVISEFPRSV